MHFCAARGGSPCARGRAHDPAKRSCAQLVNLVVRRHGPHGKTIDTIYCVEDCVSEEDMATNLAIDDKLLNEALKIGHFKSKKDTVNTALREFIQKRRQKDILGLFGTIDFDAKYDYKKARNRT